MYIKRRLIRLHTRNRKHPMPVTTAAGSDSATSTAHNEHRLMLLGSPPDMVHRTLLRETESSTPLTEACDTGHYLNRKFTPAIADCRLQDTAGSPASAALSNAALYYNS